MTQMGSHTGGTPGRVAEFDKPLHMVGEWPVHPPHHGFNPHGISARPEVNRMVTSDFIMPSSTLVPCPATRSCEVRFGCGILRKEMSSTPYKFRMRWAPWM